MNTDLEFMLAIVNLVGLAYLAGECLLYLLSKGQYKD